MKKEIGGNFELSNYNLNKEFSDKDIHGCEIFSNKIYTFSGRSALKILLEENYFGKKRVILPSFTCDTCIKPFVDCGFDISYYLVERDLTINASSLLECLSRYEYDCILYFHAYFGFDTLKTIHKLLNSLKKYKKVVTINDFTHSWLSDFNYKSDYYVASLRKWLATADGGIIASDNVLKTSQNISSYNKLLTEEYTKAALLKNDYLNNSKSVKKEDFYPLFKHLNTFFLDNEVYALSPISKSIYDNVDYSDVCKKRKENALFLCENINNTLIEKIFLTIPEYVVPFYYPIYIHSGRRQDFQNYLVKNRIYCPIHWSIPSYIENKSEYTNIYEDIISLVIDQRYDIEDMNRLVKIINAFK